MNGLPRQLSQRPAITINGAGTGLRFTWSELSGSLGDLGTFLPLAVGMAVVCGLDLGRIFVFAGLMHVLSGWWFRLPIPVQPMKAIAAVAITEGLLPGQIAAAGVLMGILMLGLALTGAVDAVVRYVPKPIVRGIQAGVGLKLALTGVDWLSGVEPVGNDDHLAGGLHWLGGNSWLVAGIVGAVLAWPRLRRGPILLVVFIAGLVLMFVGRPDLVDRLIIQAPRFELILPDAEAWWVGLWRGAVAQLPLTLLNSVVALCALSEDYFQGRGLAPRRVAGSVGMMNLICVPLGAMPMCHGAGGLAAQYHFGARTGGSVIMLGAMKIIAGLLFGAGLIGVFQAYPRSVLAVMLIFAGWALARPARDCLRGEALLVAGVTAAFILISNAAVGLAVGLVVVGGLWVRRKRKR